jgi:hypothetical protein
MAMPEPWSLSTRKISRPIPPQTSPGVSGLQPPPLTKAASHRSFVNSSVKLVTSQAEHSNCSPEPNTGNDLYPAPEVHRDPNRYFGYKFVRQYSTMLIEPQTYLNALLRDFYTAGGKVVVKEFRDRRELMRLPERVIFNCTGLGAGALFGDKKLSPVRGQLEILIPQPEVDYCYLSSGYMFPRHDGIVLGGTFDHDDWSLEPRADQRDWILGTHKEVMKGLKP